MKYNKICVLFVSFFSFLTVEAQNPTADFVLDTKKVGAPIQSTMYGLFFEDINFAADGGLYAELVKNRSFDFPQQLMGWYTFGNVEVRNDNPPFANNPTYLQLSRPSHSHKQTGIENEGFRGIGFKKDAGYRFSVWGKKVSTTSTQKIRVELIDSNNHVIGKRELNIDSDDWVRHEIILTASATEPKGRLRIFFVTDGTICLDHVSLFPIDTWKGRANGLRADLAQALYDINPGVFRFPGGCIVEGTEIDDRYDWKKSIGAIENRPINSNRWEYTFTNRFFPDYFQSYGLGFYEYFLLSEDLGAEPLPIINVGLVCQYQNDGEHCHVPVGELQSLVQDALDLIEFANGSPTSTWGKTRVDMGHPAPFGLKYIGIGNEQWGKKYPERLAVFIEAIRAQYPQMKIIGSSGPSADGKEFDYLWPEMKRLKVDLVDEHYYKDPQWFLNSASRYDNYNRKGPAVFAGEYACHVPSRANNFQSALYEAAFMTGLERNADIVHMCTYAPLFAHIDAWQWRPDMIWFDNLSMVKTPNYYVQQLYGHNAGTNVMSLSWNKTNKTNKENITGQDGLYASAVFDRNDNCYIVKIANVNPSERTVRVTLSGLKKTDRLYLGECLVLQSDSVDVANTLSSPQNIAPVAAYPRLENHVLSIDMAGQSFGVYRIHNNIASLNK